MAEQDHGGLNEFLNTLGDNKLITVETLVPGLHYTGQLETVGEGSIVVNKSGVRILIRKDAIATVRHAPQQSDPVA
jgi:sRNA-binding regulator protein Hfq